LLHALHSFKREFLTPKELAYEAIYVERHLLKDKVGCQDQIMAAFGGFNIIEFRNENDISVSRVPISPKRLEEFEQYLFLVFTGVKRKASDIVAQQLKRVDQNRPQLKAMRSMVEKGFEILTGNRPLQEFGELLDEAWQAKRSLDNCISNTSIDETYERGRKAGASGGKLLGAGGGGFLLFFARPEVHKKLVTEFSDQQLLKVKVNAPGSQIIYCQ
jgi:D-glycero-alpha-D-manno-heptose-7-phosphate kinase